MVRIDWQFLYCEFLLTIDGALRIVATSLIWIAEKTNSLRMPILRYIQRNYAP